MFVPFSQLPPEARVWIFQSDRPFSAAACEGIQSRLKAFTDEWAVHGIPMNTSFQILHDHFIVLAADETQQAASGCSIDSSVRVLKEIEQTFGVNLFERTNVAFSTGGSVQLFPLASMKEKFASGVLNEESLTFNNLVNTKADLEARWLVRAGDTWLRRYLPKPLEKAQ